MKLDLWFPTPIWLAKFENLNDHHYKQAIEYCRELNRFSVGRNKSNIGGWQSEDLYLEDTNNTPLQVFFENIEFCFTQLQRDLDTPNTCRMANIWVNINNRNDFNAVHDHPQSDLAGVFYLTENNSEIIFHRNKDVPKWSLDKILSNASTPVSYFSATYTPQRGQCLFFPSWLHHQVVPNNNAGERISVAFNMNIIDNRLYDKI